jgi:hypothetical protein
VSDEKRRIDPLRTALAAKGVELSALFFVVFEHFEIPGAPPRRPRLTAPHGPSTEGGRIARQHIALEPAEGQPGHSVVIGWADSALRRVELRSYQLVAENFRRRAGTKLDMSPGAYRRFLKQAEAFFTEQGFSIVELTQAATGAEPAPRRSTAMVWVLVLVSTLAIGVCIGVLLMLINRGLLVVP